MTYVNSTEDFALIDIETVVALTSLSKTTIYRLIGCDRFPRPIALVPGRRRVAWKESEVRQWADSPLDWPGGLAF